MIPLIKTSTNVFPLSGEIATKVLSYEADCNNRGLDISNFA
jgi:hypothetical protein